MTETTLFVATAAMLLAAVLIPVPVRGRFVLWTVMVGLILTMWIGVTLGLVPASG
jgi:hypothetical protein